MQHRYVPDLGDFSKFVVIDALSGNGEVRTALIWYLTDPDELNESHKNDGKHTGYLEDDRLGFGRCHPQLYSSFQAIHATGIKAVTEYPCHGVLPNIAYFDEPLSYAGCEVQARSEWRQGWHSRALAAAQRAELVVLDPDNGLMPPRVGIGTKHAIKYSSLQECAGFYGSGQRTLIVYQHGHRQGPVDAQADQALDRLCRSLDTPREKAFALRFHRGTPRCYLVVPSRSDAEKMRKCARALIDSPWGDHGHFSLIQ